MECRRTRVRLPPPPPIPVARQVREWEESSPRPRYATSPDLVGGRRIDFIVDTSVSCLVLPLTWKGQFGEFEVEEAIETKLAGQGVAQATLCGPARIRIEGFRVVHGDVVFMHMEAKEPLLGHIPLAQSGGRGRRDQATGWQPFGIST